MSYILEALKKADRERTLGDVPDLETAHWGERRRQRNYRWVWVVVALLVVNGTLLAVLLGRNDDAVQSPAPGSGIADQLPQRITPQAGSTAVQPSRQITRPREPVYVPPVVQRPASAVAAAPAYARQPVAAVAPAGLPAASQGVPYWDDLPLEFRSGLTLPHIDVHVYDDDPARRFILVDLQKYREDETLESGAVVEAINADSIQLYYQGTRFLMER
ncbi:MAG: general secretion pathway protein GspB [Gammaproteobacteria bacterium]|jgi:general secretion pathway protein B